MEVIALVLAMCGLATLVWIARILIALRQARSLGKEATRELDTAISGARAMLYRYHSERAPQAQAQIQDQLRSISLSLAQLDAMQRHRYRARIAEIASRAAREGISISPPGW